jgi:hypothetical protein
VLWDGGLVRDVTNPDFVDTTDWYGLKRFYWGTTTQGVDALLAGWGIRRIGNQFISVYNNVRLGVNRDTPPNIEVIAGRWPKPSWWTGADTKIGDDVNAAAFIAADLLQDPITGLGLPDARLDTASFNSVGATLAF